MEPFEHLVDEVLERRNRRNKEVNTETNSEEGTGLLLQTVRPLPSESEEETEPEEERPIETHSIMEFEAPAPQTTTTKATELKLNQPKPFTGKRNEIDDFLQDVALYLEINDEIYNTDKKKIGYTLTFMYEGDAKSWKAQFLRNAITDTGLDLGTWRDFVTKVQDAFAPYDALEEITNLKMGDTPIDDHIARYQILLDRSGVPRDSPSAIDYFRRTLNIPLQRKLLDLPTPPKNLKEWYEWAARLDNN